jgi:hypothetical protein
MTIQENRQQLFEKMVTALYHHCISGTIDFCKYRLGELKCAIGHLIPDELYEPEMEHGYIAKRLIQIFPDILPIFDKQTQDEGLIDFLTSAQRKLHDDFTLNPKDHLFRTFLLRNAREFAARYVLNINFLEKLIHESQQSIR